MKNTYNINLEITFGVPQVLILGPLHFKIYVCNMFLGESNITSNRDDSTPYTCEVIVTNEIF